MIPLTFKCNGKNALRLTVNNYTAGILKQNDESKFNRFSRDGKCCVQFSKGHTTDP